MAAVRLSDVLALMGVPADVATAVGAEKGNPVVFLSVPILGQVEIAPVMMVSSDRTEAGDAMLILVGD